MSEFLPPPLLRNPHLQCILASTTPRKLTQSLRQRALIEASKTVVVDCGEGTRLLGEYSTQTGRSKGLVILIHGWEGSSSSTYMLSCGGTLYRAGYDVFRLNLRDHGPSHHLNRELFNSTRLEEVVAAVETIQRLYPHDWNYLAGFSLGGNFALRVTAASSDREINLDKTVAICPVLDPIRTMKALEEGWWVYEKYFVRKWKRSLQKKLALYPELGYADELPKFKTLRGMNAYFVPNHTGFASTEAYLKAYALTGETLAHLPSPAHIITAHDDPMILVEDLQRLATSEQLTVEVSAYGGHCGFIKSWQLDSWIDDRVLALITNTRQQPQAGPKTSLPASELLRDCQ